jgi:hypothetical protein
VRFISNGDYIFPFQFTSYWSEHVYMWSFQHGAANPDGIMRLPGRLIDMLVFATFGNLGIGYFYVLSCMVIAFAAFFWFCRNFLDVQRRGTRLLGALFFTLNPIFLGNLSKVGLILAAAMLPIALTALKLGFEKRRFSYFLLYIAALNISLLHPFTFTLNLVASAVYAVYAVRKHSVFVRDNLLKFATLGLVALLLNAYLILPLASLGTVSKDALSDNVASQPVDYTSLVDIANTGDIFTGLSLSKGVLKDYEFYGARTWPFYFLGVFAFYAILFGVYVRVEKRAKPAERRRFVVSLGIFLVLLALSTATFLHADTLIKFAIGLPGGWMFRSPLKWQLYMPLPLITALVIALKYMHRGKGLHIVYVGLLATFVLMNTYLFVQIYSRLLTPRTLAYFGALADAPLEGTTILFVNSNDCMTFARDNPGVATELNQVFISKNVQVKHIDSGNFDTALAGQYDYVFGCHQALDAQVLTKRYAFARTQTFANGVYELYRNTQSTPYASAVNDVYALDEPMALSGKYAFTAKTFGGQFNFIGRDSTVPATGLQDLFDSLSPASIKRGALTTTVAPIQPGQQELHLTHDTPLFYKTEGGNTISVTNAPGNGMTPVPGKPLALNIPEGQTISLSYRDSNYSYANVIGNGSVEQGLWEKEVGDCNNYDNQAAIFMRINKLAHTDGKQSLELESKKHIACTGPDTVVVRAGDHYLLHFDYQSKGGRYAGYYAGFDDVNGTSSGQRLPSKDGTWTSFTTELVVPIGGEHLNIVFYAYPDSAPGKTGKALYDNVSLTKIPDVKNRFFMVQAHGPLDTAAPVTKTRSVNPTKTLIRVDAGVTPFYLRTNESYNRLWQLRLDNGAHGLSGLFGGKGRATPATDHMRINGSMNGWYINPEILCEGNPAGCARNADGTYTLFLVMEFTPQRWFYIGTLVSAAAAAATIGYVAYDVWRAREARR